MQVDLLERYLAGSIETKHDHPGDPEEENILSCLHYRCGIEFCEIWTIGEAGGRKRPLSA